MVEHGVVREDKPVKWGGEYFQVAADARLPANHVGVTKLYNCRPRRSLSSESGSGNCSLCLG